MTLHPFRFSIGANPIATRAEWIAAARKAEALGYSSIGMGDHPALAGGLALIPAMVAAAEATSRLRFLTGVLNNDLRHPAILAQDAATLDLLSGGRLELGIGAGWSRADYQALGLPFDSIAVRRARLEEALTVIRQLLCGGPVTYAGTYYQINGLDLKIAPAQQPHTPIMIGGGGRRTLELAARQADIVGIDLRSSGGKIDMASYTAAAFEEQISWVRAAAGVRADQLVIHTLVHTVIITDDHRRGVEQVIAGLQEDRTAGFLNNVELSSDQILESPHVLIGTVDQIVEDLQERRERFGLSYISVGGDAEAFAPVVERLAGR